MKEQETPITGETLQALMDGEYSAEETAEFLARIRGDRALSHEACELRMLKDTVRLAYRDIPDPPPISRAAGRRGTWPAAAAAMLILVLGITLGWSVNSVVAPSRFVMLDPHGKGKAPATADSREMRIVFHLTDPDMTAAGDLLNDVRDLLEDYERVDAPLRVEVVAHGEGLGLLRSRLSKHKAIIHELAVRYPNLTFVACRNSIDRLRVEQGTEVLLLPEAVVIDSGVEHVVRRQKAGWAYIRG